MKHSLQLGSLTTINIIFIFLFQWYLLIQFGAGIETDAFFASTTIPQLILVVISGSLINVLIPLLSSQSEVQCRHDAWGFFFLVSGIFILLAVVLYFLAPWWASIIVPGFSEEGKNLTLSLTRIQLISMILSALSSVQYATYHARQKFLWAEFTLVASNFCALLLLAWALPVFGIIAAAWVGVFRAALQIVLLMPGMGRPSIPNIRRPVIHQAWQRIKPLLLGATYYKTGPLVDRYLLSMGGNGNLSLYYLAHQIYSAITQVLIKAFISPMLPSLSKLDSAGDTKTFKQRYYRRLVQISAVSIAVTFGIFFLGKPILNLLLAHGNINSSDIAQLWLILIYLSGMFIGGVIGQLTTSAFYASGNTTTVTLMAVITYTINLPAKVVSFYVWGIPGLAISTSIYLIVNMLLLIFLLEKIKFHNK